MRLIVLDLELTQPSCKIIQIGAVLFDLKKGVCESSFNKICNPGELPCERITELTGITPEMVAEATSFETVVVEFWTWVAESKCGFQLAAWGSDVWELFNASRAAGIQPIKPPKNLNIKEVAKLFRIPLSSVKKSGGLKNSMDVFGLHFIGKQHNAYDDALNTAYLLHHFTKVINLGTKTLEHFKDW